MVQHPVSALTVGDLMSSPAVTCAENTSLGEAAGLMQHHDIGSVVVVEEGKVAGILTERDLLRAAAGGSDPNTEPVRAWMTANPDVLGPEEPAGTAWASLRHHRYRHLPVVEDGNLVGVVSMRNLMGAASLTAGDASLEAPRGLEGVIVATTAVGDVRGHEGFYHYRQYSAVDLAASRQFEDVWHLLLFGELPDLARRREFLDELHAHATLPESFRHVLATVASAGSPLEVLRTGISLLGAHRALQPLSDIDQATARADAIGLGAAVPVLLASTYRLARGLQVVEPRSDLPLAANYLWMLSGTEPDPEQARALDQYLIIATDHGFNASTFTARVISSTQADLASAICGAIGALSGPLHGGAPSRALDMLDAIGRVENAEAWLRSAVASDQRLMGFGHRIYRTEDPRAAFLRTVAQRLGGPLVDLAVEVEQVALRVLDELKPGRELHTNLEFYAGVVMDRCGIPRDLFTPTFAVARTVGWTVHVLEQMADNRLFRPSARYVGPPPPQPVPDL